MSKLTPASFAGAARKVAWAKQHIANMEQVMHAAHQSDDSAFSAKPQSEASGTLVSVNFGNFLRHSPALQMMAGDAIHNLRCALDHLAWAIVSAFKEPDPRLYFPIDVELESLKGQRGFREIESVAPDIADLIVSEIRPYGAGNSFVNLNQLDRADKHRLLLVHQVAATTLIYAAKHDDDVPEEAANCFILVAPAGRVPNPGSKAALHNEKYRDVAFDVRFDRGLPCENESVIPTLHQFARLIAGVVQTIAAHVDGSNRDAG